MRDISFGKSAKPSKMVENLKYGNVKTSLRHSNSLSILLLVSTLLQDFNYLSSNDFEITLELGCDKYPKGNELEGYWNENLRPMMEFVWLVSLVYHINKLFALFANNYYPTHIVKKALEKNAFIGSIVFFTKSTKGVGGHFDEKLFNNNILFRTKSKEKNHVIILVYLLLNLI